MKKIGLMVGTGIAAWLSLGNDAGAGDCIVPPLGFNSHAAELTSEVTVKAGKDCGFGIVGIGGAIEQVRITQKPKVGVAGVRGTTSYYIAKPGYQGPDEFAYSYVGTDQYGGPMRIAIKRRVTVVP